MSSMQFLFHGLDENENKINSQTHTHHYAFETWLPSHSSVRFSYKYSGASFTSIAWKILKTSKNYISTSYSDAHEEFLHLFLWVWTGCIVQNARWPYNSTNSFIGSISLPKDPKENKQDAVDILCHYKGLTKTLQKETKRNKKKGALTSLFVSVNFKAESGYRISQDDNISRTHLSSTRQAESELDPERRELLDRWKLTEDPAVRYPVKTASIWREEWVWKVFCSCCIWTHRQIFILLYKARSLNDPEVWKMSSKFSRLFHVIPCSPHQHLYPRWTWSYPRHEDGSGKLTWRDMREVCMIMSSQIVLHIIRVRTEGLVTVAKARARSAHPALNATIAYDLPDQVPILLNIF